VLDAISDFHPSLLFAGKAVGYQCGAHYRTYSHGWLPALPSKYLTPVEVTDIGKHSSLLRYCINYCCKKFYSTGPSLFQTFVYYGHSKFYDIGPSDSDKRKKSFITLAPGYQLKHFHDEKHHLNIGSSGSRIFEGKKNIF